jgi:predicted RecA/RadA family phage recombinase
MTDSSTIVINEGDNVGLAIKDLKAGDTVALKIGNNIRSVTIKEDIKFMHKFAIADIKAGDKVMKYGQVIGGATKDIATGEHVHTHKLKSLRGQFGKKKAGGTRE